MAKTPFIHLRVHSAYSLAEGAIKVKDLVKRCLRLRMPAVAVTDTNNMFGALEFAMEAKAAGVQPIIGAQVSVMAAEGAAAQLVLLVQTEQGYRNLCRILSEAYLEGDPQHEIALAFDRIAALSEGLICLTGGAAGPIGRALQAHQAHAAESYLKKLKTAFDDRLYMELQRHGIPEEEAVEEAMIELAYAHHVPLVATNECFFMQPESHEAHDALLCIAAGRYINEEDRRRVTVEHYFKNADEMAALFSDLPEAIENTVQIAKRCGFLLEMMDPILPAYPTEAGRSEAEELKAQAEAGLSRRLQGRSQDDASYRERLAFELGVINKMGYPGYFLIVSDFIGWAKDNGIPVGPGRGSGAGSVVAWALRITDLDPIEHGLLFERFLNPERVSMPDFDIDFCQERRDEVIRYVQGKYGRDRVAQIITFGKLQARAVVRDVGRVLQIPYGQVDRIAKLIPNNPANPVTLEEAIKQDAELRAERDKDDTQRKLIDIALQLEGLYRHASTHAAGVVIGDRPLHELVPLYRDPRSDMPVTQFNMTYVEKAGLVKFDFLGLKTMTVIQKTVDMLKARGVDIDLDKIPLDDEKTFKLLASGNATGLFQLESSGMRDVLRKMKPNRFDDITALVALYRPGPMDNIPRYIATKEGKEQPDYLHPVLRPILEETYGIMIYQEQVMQAAQILAGYTLGEADLLRRAMGKKIKAEMDAQRQSFVDGAKKSHDVPARQAEEIFEQIDKFAGYGFNKSHAAAYALIAYWTAWLKANYTLEFMAASMTLDMGNTDKLAVFKQDLDRLGVRLLQPDINSSHPFFKVEDGGVRYALAALKGVGEAAMQFIVYEREQNGVFRSVQDFATRLDPKALNKRQMEQLAAAGAFDSLNSNRAQMQASAEMILRFAQAQNAEKAAGQVSLFAGAEGPGLNLPDLPGVTSWDDLERLGKEFSAVGFYLSAHPLESRQAQFENLGIASYASIEHDLQNKAMGRYKMAGVLIKKQEKVSQKGSKYAFLQLSDPTGVYEVTLFSEQLHQAREFLEPGRALLLTAEAEQREDQIRITVQKIEPLDSALEGRIRTISIHMRGSGAAPQIKQFLDIEGKGQSQIALYVALEDGRRAQIKLPGSWSLSQQARSRLRTHKDVEKIMEG